MIRELFIDNYKCFRNFRLPLNEKMNIIVGDNETGKSTILEVINLALTCRLNGRQLNYELSPYLFNDQCVAEYLTELRNGGNPELPRITIELYFEESDELQYLRGTNNSKREDSLGLKVEVYFDEDYTEEYEKLLGDREQMRAIPVEYYCVKWYSFANNYITARGLPVGASYIDAAAVRLYTGTGYHLRNVISEYLNPKEKADLAVAYRRLKEEFADKPQIAVVNTKLSGYKGVISDKPLNISIDVSHKANWETSLVPYLGDLPLQFIGRGEQSIIKTLLALERMADKTKVVLLEEPENHLSFSSMRKLVSRISSSLERIQIILATHSPYVLNKLGLENLVLLSGGRHSSLEDLSVETQSYFKRFPGFDTLRLILAKRAILVEGPSDELIVQRAYRDEHNDRLPLDNGIDVISVRGLSFKRFLDIAKELRIPVTVVTDNDGDYESKVKERYAAYADCRNITVLSDTDDSCKTLERQIIKANDHDTLNAIFGTSYEDDNTLATYMKDHKTECALKIFESQKKVEYPDYIRKAIEEQ